MNKRCFKLFKKAKNNPKGFRFSELQRLCECVDMGHDRTAGSHVIYKRKIPPPFTLSIQEMKDGKAKPYQVNELIDFIEEYDLAREE